MSGELLSAVVSEIASAPQAGWATGMEVCVPSPIATLLSQSGSAEAAVDAVRMHAAFTPSPPASTRLPFSYQFVPLTVRTTIGHLLGRMQRRRVRSWAHYPRWPLDLSADFVSDLLGAAASPFGHDPTPVLLSHDIDTGDGLKNLVPRFLPIEESVGGNTSSAFTATITATRRRLHPRMRDANESRPRPLVERYSMIGYRAPSMPRTHELLDGLEGLYRYDSIPTSGGLFPVPNNGCASARPFRVRNMFEIPLTMPRDGSLRFLDHNPQEILTIWKRCAEMISNSDGIVSVLTHCEDRFSGNAGMLAVYRRFLEYLAEDTRYAFSTPAGILEQISASAAS